MSDPDFVLCFLPPGENLPNILAALAKQWPASLRFGCEAVTQFAESRLTTGGALHLFWLDDPSNRPRVEVLETDHEHGVTTPAVSAFAKKLAGDNPVFLLTDGLRFPVQQLLIDLRTQLGEKMPQIVGGLASQEQPISHMGSRVFLDERVFDAACLAVVLKGIEMTIEVVRGWEPASPTYTVTRAEGNVLYEIDGTDATEWYRHFFTTAEGMAPLPLSAYRFPLIIEGPSRERQGLYRSMRSFDDPSGAVTYWGDLQTGDRVRLGIGDGGSLVRTAALLSASVKPEGAILYSCVGRELVLGDMAEREVATIHDVLGRVALSGFFSFGEIGPSSGGSLAYYNQTAVLALLREKPLR